MFTRLALETLAAYVRTSPIDAGRWRLERSAYNLARSYVLPDHNRIIRTRHGFRLTVSLRDWLGKHVFLTGDYERRTSGVIKARLKPGCTFVDVGANIGYFTLLGSRTVGRRGSVIAFEPLPATRKRLERNVHLNGATNIEIHCAAASDCNGSATFYEGPSDHLGQSSLRKLVEVQRRPSAIQVPTTRLDDVLRSRTVDLIKIDVEGAEVRVLMGFQDVLTRDRPDIIVEVTDAFLLEMGASAHELCAMLRRLGYSMFKITGSGLRAIQGWSADLGPQFNALFTVHRLPCELLTSPA
jgi:FkbM family methyltransferase